jgi:heme/copper-type cytochrome/quinol oxidase subunit 2
MEAAQFVAIFVSLFVSLLIVFFLWFCRESTGEQSRTGRASAAWLSIG